MYSPQAIKAIRKNLRVNSRLSQAFDALSDPTRYQIFTLLAWHRDLCATDIAAILRISVPAACHHLKILEFSGITKRQRVGQMICYELRREDPVVKSIEKFIGKLAMGGSYETS